MALSRCMHHLPSRLDRVAILACLLAVTATPALSQPTIYTTFGSTPDFDPGFVQFGNSPGTGYGDSFISPVTATVGTALLALQVTNPGTTMTLEITSNRVDRQNTGIGVNVPAGAVGTFNSTTLPTDPGIATFTASGSFELEAGVKYWLTATAATGQVNWFYSDQHIDNLTAFQIGDAWHGEQVGSTALAFEVVAVPEPTTLALGALGFALCLSWVLVGGSPRAEALGGAIALPWMRC